MICKAKQDIIYQLYLQKTSRKKMRSLLKVTNFQIRQTINYFSNQITTLRFSKKYMDEIVPNTPLYKSYGNELTVGDFKKLQ